MTLPQRKQLPHELPLWVKREEAAFFFTFCCHPRNENHLANDKTATAIVDTVAHRHKQEIWFAHIFLLMPDHAHALISFPSDGKAIQTLVKDGKHGRRSEPVSCGSVITSSTVFVVRRTDGTRRTTF